MRFANRVVKGALAAVAVAFAFVSCIKETSIPNAERERVSLDAWIKLNKPELINNYQSIGGYYVEILSEGETENISRAVNDYVDYGSEPLMEHDTCWVFTKMTGRDINGSICLTRSHELAELSGSFSYFTHYVPYVNYCGSYNMGLLEGSYLSMRNELKIGDGTYKMRKGSKVRLYLPSSIAYGESGSAVQGGYEGQYHLDPSRPLIMEIEVLSAIKNPSNLELEMVKQYIGYDEVWSPALKPESEKVNANDDLKLTGLYYNLNYNPESDNVYEYKYLRPECMNTPQRLNQPYTDNKKYAPGKMAEINQKINDILLARFGKGLNVSELSEAERERTQVTKNGRAKVWYVLRFLDGFVVDTNIAELRTYIFNETAPTCEVFSYSPSDDEGKEPANRQAIGAWYYGIPHMHYGAYGQIITTSGYAYGSVGMSGSTTTITESTGNSASYDQMAYYNYYNYYNSYYNYYNPYYNYYDYSYYNYDAGSSAESTTTKTTIGTEILPYTPLIFTLYVEPFE